MKPQTFPVVDQEVCLTCRACVGICPTNAIKQLRREVSVDYSACNSCGTCVAWCPAKAIRFDADVRATKKYDLRKVSTPPHLDKLYDIIIVGGGGQPVFRPP